MVEPNPGPRAVPDAHQLRNAGLRQTHWLLAKPKSAAGTNGVGTCDRLLLISPARSLSREELAGDPVAGLSSSAAAVRRSRARSVSNRVRPLTTT